MTIQANTLALGTFVPMLRALSHCLDKGGERAAAAGPGPQGLLAARLAPDMFDLTSQVQFACIHATDALAQLTGLPPTPHPAGEKSVEDLKALIARTVGVLEAAPAEAFAEAEARDIRIPLDEQMEFRFTGERFLRDWALPHFYFHLVTAYDILRTQGVDVGKRDYLSQIGDAIRPRTPALAP